MPRRSTFSLLVTLHFLGFDIPQILQWADNALNLISSSPDITTPIVPIPTAQGHLNNLRNTSNTRLSTSGPSLTDLEKSQVNLVINDFAGYAGQIQQIANNKILSSGDYVVGRSFVEGLTFVPRQQGRRSDQIFGIINIMSHGNCTVTIPVDHNHNKVIYLVRFSQDPTNWSIGNMVMAMVSKVNLTELMADKRYYFQYAVLSNVGKENTFNTADFISNIAWSDPISAMIL